MASITKAEGGWHAFVCVGGKRRSKRFDGKSKAQDWAAGIERQLKDGESTGMANGRTVADALERYEREVTPAKKGARWESLRLKAILRDPLAKVSLSDLSPADIAAWRDRRLRQVTSASVFREMCLLSHVFTITRREWRWIRENPVSDVRRPKKSKPRDRRVSDQEAEMIKVATGYRPDALPKTVTAKVGAAFFFAIETAMRLGEICGLDWDDVDCDTRVATLHDTKNGWKREVPLSGGAMAILEQLRAARNGADPIFDLDTERASALFRKSRKTVEIHNLTFHDSRHEAITRLSKKLDVLALARMVGHRDIRMLMIYYNKSAADIAREL